MGSNMQKSRHLLVNLEKLVFMVFHGFSSGFKAVCQALPDLAASSVSAV